MTCNYIKYGIFSSSLLTFRGDASHTISGGGIDAAWPSLCLARRMGVARVGTVGMGRGYGNSELQHLPFVKNISTLEPSMKTRDLGNPKSPNERKASFLLGGTKQLLQL